MSHVPFVRNLVLFTWVILFFSITVPPSLSAAAARSTLAGHVPPPIANLTPVGSPLATNRLYIAIGLPLRNQTGLHTLIEQLYDPGSTNFHRFLTSAEFTARFGPSEADYQAVIRFAQANGLRVDRTH